MFIATLSIRLKDTSEGEINEKCIHLAAKSKLNVQHFASGEKEIMRHFFFLICTCHTLNNKNITITTYNCSLCSLHGFIKLV